MGMWLFRGVAYYIGEVYPPLHFLQDSNSVCILFFAILYIYAGYISYT